MCFGEEFLHQKSHLLVKRRERKRVMVSEGERAPTVELTLFPANSDVSDHGHIAKLGRQYVEMTPQFDNFLIYGRISGITMSCTLCFRGLLRLKWFPVHHTQICKSVLDFLILNFKFFFNILQLLIQFMQKGSAILELALILKAINFIF